MGRSSGQRGRCRSGLVVEVGKVLPGRGAPRPVGGGAQDRGGDGWDDDIGELMEAGGATAVPGIVSREALQVAGVGFGQPLTVTFPGPGPRFLDFSDRVSNNMCPTSVDT